MKLLPKAKYWVLAVSLVGFTRRKRTTCPTASFA